jgi:hypothetical protein
VCVLTVTHSEQLAIAQSCDQRGNNPLTQRGLLSTLTLTPPRLFLIFIHCSAYWWAIGLRRAETMGGKRCLHGKMKYSCTDCRPCPHGKVKGSCAVCNPCPHGKVKSDCAECTPCPHGNLKTNCVACAGCPHGKRRFSCAECKKARADAPSSKRIKREP